MKKHLSVFGLFARCSAYKILGILFVMSLAEIGLFVREVKKAVATYHELLSLDLVSLDDLERVMDQSGLFWCFAVALILITVVLCLPGCAFGSQTGYTLRRLSVEERATFFHQAVYNVLIYTVFFAIQIALAFFLCVYYQNTIPESFVSNQTLFLAFYRNEFLHGLLPLSDLALWSRNAALILALGFCAAEFPYKQRRGKYALSILFLLFYGIAFFRRSIGDLFHCILTVLIALLAIGILSYLVCRGDREAVSEGE